MVYQLVVIAELDKQASRAHSGPLPECQEIAELVGVANSSTELNRFRLKIQMAECGW